MRKIFIVSINGAGWLTLSGIGLASASCFLLIRDMNLSPMGQNYFLAMGLIYLGMLADAMDGVLARKMNWESEFGRYLDGFGDVFLYLVFPNLALLHMGANGMFATLAMLVMVCGGVLRLAFFNISGNEKEDGKLSYRGMPVFWSLLALLPLHFLSSLLSQTLFSILAGTIWMLLGICNLINRRFFKPKNVKIMLGILLSASAWFFLYFALGF